VVVHLAAVLTELTGQSAALLGEFGASDEAVLDVLFGRSAPEAKLPFELPSSMDAVRGQLPDVPHDSRDPLFPSGTAFATAEGPPEGRSNARSRQQLVAAVPFRN